MIVTGRLLCYYETAMTAELHFFAAKLIVAILLLDCATARIIHGTFTPREDVQHVTRFCFHGEAAVKYEVNDTSTARLYIFSDEQWEALPGISQCLEKLKHTSYNVELQGKNGKYALQPPPTKPTFFHVGLADPTYCGSKNSSVQKVSFTLQTLNPDSQGAPENHFSYEDFGLQTFHQLTLLGYIICACIYGNRLLQTVCKGGPMHLAIKILTISMMLHAASFLCSTVNFMWYSRHGEDRTILKLLSVALDGMSQYKALVMMFSMSVGWTLSSATVFDAKEEKLVNNILVGVSVMQVILNYLQLTSFLVVTRLIICGAIAYNVKKTVAKERSALRRDFYGKFIIDCYIWWLSYPLVIVFSVVFAEYSRKKLVIFGVTAGQAISALLMYKLFLSRSLYWEVSTLSASTLPLRMERGFGTRKYTG